MAPLFDYFLCTEPSKSTSSKTDINPDFENSSDELFGDISDNDRPYHPEGDDEETTSEDNLESPAHSDGQKITEQVEKNQISERNEDVTEDSNLTKKRKRNSTKWKCNVQNKLQILVQ